MATQIAEAYVQVIPTTRGISNAIGNEFGTVGSVAAGSMGAALLGGLKKFAAPIAAVFAGIGLTNLFGDSIREASDFQESVNAVQVTFGKLSSEILDYGKVSARTLGLDKTTFNQYAVAFSNWADTLKGSGQTSADVIYKLIQRGSDFASVYNIEVADALRLFQAGLAGETEPLRRFGIDMTMASIEAYAMANGIWDGADAMTESEKVMARYGVIMAGTNKTQGDFARTSDMLANATRITKETWEEFQMTLGALFLPAITAVTLFIRDNVIPVFNDFVYNVLPAFGAWWQEHIGKHFEAFTKEHGPALAETWDGVIRPAIESFWKEVFPVIKGMFEWIANDIREVVIPYLEKFANWFNDPNNKKYIEFMTKLVMSFVAALGFLAGIIFGAIGALVEMSARLASTAVDWLNFFKDISLYAEKAINVMIQATNRLRSWLNDTFGVSLALFEYVNFDINDTADGGNRYALPGLANGGTVIRSGATLVGENGPEILNLSRGSSVIPLDRGYGQTVIYNAAPNQSIDNERALFTAMRRAKVVAGW